MICHGIVAICKFGNGVIAEVCLLYKYDIRFVFLHCEKQSGSLFRCVEATCIKQNYFEKFVTCRQWRGHGQVV